MERRLRLESGRGGTFNHLLAAKHLLEQSVEYLVAIARYLVSESELRGSSLLTTSDSSIALLV